MADRRKALGDFGEDAAAAHLERAGLRILARKWRCPLGELDIVAQDGQALVFVEVRTRRGGPAGLAQESVTRAKQARLARLAYSYLGATGHPGDWRIDVVAVVVEPSGRVAHIDHIRNAVEGVT